MLPANLATAMIADVRDAREAANLEKMVKLLKIQKMILNFDATLAEENDVDAVVMTTAPENQRMSLASRRMLLVNLATAMIADARAASEVASLEKMTRLQKNPKMILSFDATFAKANNVVDAVVMMTALASQKTVPVNLATTIPDVEARTASHEKMRLPPKHQKMILNFDGTLAANATDVVAAVVMTTARGNQKMMSPVSRRMLPANLATAMIADVRDAREAANLEKMVKLLKIQKMILNFDATFAEENDLVDAVVMM